MSKATFLPPRTLEREGEEEGAFAQVIHLLEVAGGQPAAVGVAMYLLVHLLSNTNIPKALQNKTTTTTTTPTQTQPTNPLQALEGIWATLTQDEKTLVTDLESIFGQAASGQPLIPLLLNALAKGLNTASGTSTRILPLSDALALKGVLLAYIASGGNLAGLLSSGAGGITALASLAK